MTKHECIWIDPETGAQMVPTMWNVIKNRNVWRKTIRDRMFQLLCIVISQAVFITGGAFVWASSIRQDISKLAIKVDQHSLILDKYIMALMDARMASQASIERKISDTAYQAK